MENLESSVGVLSFSFPKNGDERGLGDTLEPLTLLLLPLIAFVLTVLKVLLLLVTGVVLEYDRVKMESKDALLKRSGCLVSTPLIFVAFLTDGTLRS